MIHPQDLQDFKSMTGGAPMPPGFEEEYLKWLRFQHRRRKQGPLGDLMTPLLVWLGVAPPAECAAPPVVSTTNWRQVKRDARVIVQDEGEELKGRFRGVGRSNLIAVGLDGETWVREYPPRCVSLDEPVPHDLTLKPSEREAMIEQEPAIA